MRDWQRTGSKLPVTSKGSPNRAGEPGPGEGRTGERIVNLCKRRHRKIAETRSTRQYWSAIGPGTPSCPGVNTAAPGVKKAPTPTESPSCGTCKPRWGLPGKSAVSRPRGRSKPPAGRGRIEKRKPAAERIGKTITRRIGLYNPTRKGADAILVSCSKDDVKVANLKVKVGCGSIDSANGAEGRTNLGPCAIGDDGSSGKLLEPCARKPARTVLRGGRRSDAPPLPDCPRRA